MTGSTDRQQLNKLVDRFPHAEARIRNLFMEDEDFRELCLDYSECLAVIARLRQEPEANHPLLEDYCETRVNLERELLKSLSPHAQPVVKPVKEPL